MNDRELLEQFADTGSQAAFAELVERHVALVHSAARRRLGGDALVEDVVQQVFALLARKSGTLGRGVVVSGWLYRATCHVASETLRGERRRRERELAAAQLDLVNAGEDETLWQRIRPRLDAAMAGLSRADQDAIVLRYFENRGLREVGELLGVSEDAAQKRISRALLKLRRTLGCEEERVPIGMLGAAVIFGAVQPVPAGMAATVSGAVLAGAAGMLATTTTTTATATATAGIAAMTTTKTILGITAALGAAAVIAVQTGKVSSLGDDNADLSRKITAAEQATKQLEEQVAGLRRAATDDRRQNELLELRAEVTRLHQREQELEAENARLRQTAQQYAASEAQVRQAAQELDAAQEAAREQAKQIGIAKMNYVKRWALAFHMYAGDHDDQFPPTLAAAADYFGSVDPPGDVDPAVYAALQPDHYEVMYHGSLSEIPNPGMTILLREKEAIPDQTGLGAVRAYGFADGHSEIHRAPDGDFTAWEAERIVQPQPR